MISGRERSSAIVWTWVDEATLLYEMVSNTSLICSGLWMSSSLEDKGWEEARASTANTLWTSPSTIRSFYFESKRQNDSKNKTPSITLITITLSSQWLLRAESLPHSIRVQHGLLLGTRHRTQSLHSATSHSTTSESPDYQTTSGTKQGNGVTGLSRNTKNKILVLSIRLKELGYTEIMRNYFLHFTYYFLHFTFDFLID